MRDVVVIGGGLTGLAAAHELEQHGINYTLIEVKPRLGGSINTVAVQGFIFDSVPMIHSIRNQSAFFAYLDQLHISEGAITPHTAPKTVAFTAGTNTLVNALTATLTAPVLQRMAVSTLGRYGRSHYSICMENGMVLDARALIIASPARHSERMLHTLIPEAAHRLRDYRYQHVAYVSVGYRADDGPFSTEVDPDYPIQAINIVQAEQRMPADSVMMQAALRYEPDHGVPADAVGEIAALMGWPVNPLADHIGVWGDGETVMWRDPSHADRLRAVQALLPASVALCGSDYIPTAEPPRLDERIDQGITAAKHVIETL